MVAKGYGPADLGQRQAATAQTVYRIGSLTKQFTAAAVLKLAEDGRLSLDDELVEFLPDFPTQGYRPTVRHLLNHTSGIKEHTNLEGGRATPGTNCQAVVDLVAAQPFDFAPGERFSYTNSGYLLLGLVIEQITNRSYASQMQEHVFEPLRLHQTFFCPTSLTGQGRPEAMRSAPGSSLTPNPSRWPSPSPPVASARRRGTCSRGARPCAAAASSLTPPTP